MTLQTTEEGQVSIYLPFQKAKIDQVEYTVSGWISREDIDLQNEVIPTDVLAKALPDFSIRPVLYYSPVDDHWNKSRTRRVAGYMMELKPIKGEGIFGKAKILDMEVWDMITSGTLNGFSVGGEGAKKFIEKSGKSIQEYFRMALDHVLICKNPVSPGSVVTFAKAFSNEEETMEKGAPKTSDKEVEVPVEKAVQEASTTDRVTKLEATVERLTKFAKGEPKPADMIPDGDSPAAGEDESSAEEKPENDDDAVKALCQKVQDVCLKLHNVLYKAGNKEAASKVTAFAAALEKSLDSSKNDDLATSDADGAPDLGGADAMVGKALVMRFDEHLAALSAENLACFEVVTKALGDQNKILERIAAQPDYTNAPSTTGVFVAERQGTVGGHFATAPVSKASDSEPWGRDNRYVFLKQKGELGQLSPDDISEMSRIRTDYKTRAMQLGKQHAV